MWQPGARDKVTAAPAETHGLPRGNPSHPATSGVTWRTRQTSGVPSPDCPGVSSPVPGAHPAQWGVGCARRLSEIHAQFCEATGAGAGRGSLIYGLCVARLTGGGAWPVSGPRGMDCGSLVLGRSGAPGPRPRTRSTRDTPQPCFTARASCRRIGVGEAPKTAPLSDPQACGPVGPRATALHRARVCFAPVGRRHVRGHGL